MPASEGLECRREALSVTMRDGGTGVSRPTEGGREVFPVSISVSSRRLSPVILGNAGLRSGLLEIDIGDEFQNDSSRLSCGDDEACLR